MAESNVTPQPVALQVPTTIKSLVEALIFGAREPLSERQIQALYEEQSAEAGEQRKISYEEISGVVAELNDEYIVADRPYRIVQIAGGFQFATLPAYAEWLGKLYKEQSRRKLSQSSIETLAIIAYKQPITKPELEAIRGVNCDYVIKTLLEKDLATIVGRAPSVGRPLLYGTSKEFLKHFGLNDLNDLPRPREIQDILGESQFETERRMLEAQQGLEEHKEEEFKSRLPHIPKRKPGMDEDVKIVPKRRSREIKLRETEETATGQPERAQVELQLKETPAPTTPEVSSDSIDEIIKSPAVPVISDEQPDEREIEGNELPDENGAEVGSEMMKYVPLTQAKPKDQEVAKVGFDVGDNPEVVAPDDGLSDEAVPNQEPVSEMIPDSVTESLEAIPAVLPQVAELLVATPEIAPQLPVKVQEFVSTEIPEVSGDEENEQVPQAREDASQEERPSDPSAHQSKTRWKSWKEKIQGFIKKLFG